LHEVSRQTRNLTDADWAKKGAGKKKKKIEDSYIISKTWSGYRALQVALGSATVDR
jgi:hypothetical protein